jgi:hypothetical protein
MISSLTYSAVWYHPWQTALHDIILDLQRCISSLTYSAVWYHPWPTALYDIILDLQRSMISSLTDSAVWYQTRAGGGEVQSHYINSAGFHGHYTSDWPKEFLVFELKNTDVLRNEAVSAVQAKRNGTKWKAGYGLLEHRNLKCGSRPCPNARYCSLNHYEGSGKLWNEGPYVNLGDKGVRLFLNTNL